MFVFFDKEKYKKCFCVLHTANTVKYFEHLFYKKINI